MSEKNDPHTSTICALKVIKDGGISNWEASKVLWKNEVLADSG